MPRRHCGSPGCRNGVPDWASLRQRERTTLRIWKGEREKRAAFPVRSNSRSPAVRRGPPDEEDLRHPGRRVEAGCPGTNGSLEKGTGNIMNVHSRGARRALAAVCSTAVVAAGAAFFAAPASASGTTIGFFPSTTAASIVNVDPTTGANNPTLTYGVKLTGNSDGFPLYAQVVS